MHLDVAQPVQGNSGPGLVRQEIAVDPIGIAAFTVEHVGAKVGGDARHVVAGVLHLSSADRRHPATEGNARQLMRGQSGTLRRNDAMDIGSHDGTPWVLLRSGLVGSWRFLPARLFVNNILDIGQEISVNKMSASPKPKKIGRPRKPGGHDVLVAGRVPTAIAAMLDAYADKEGITRSEAVRRLIEAGLRRAKGRG